MNIESNELIAEFMEVRKVIPKDAEQKDTFPRYQPFAYAWYNPEQLKYHIGWDWLMPVVEKIFINDNYKHRNEDVFRAIEDALLIPDKMQIYRAVVRFIEWYKLNLVDTK